MNFDEILERQREYFESGATLDLDFRRDMLSKLYIFIKKYEDRIFKALKEDLGKSEYESLMCEVGMCTSEISFMKKRLRSFMAPKRVKTPISQFSSKSYTISAPRGCTLIISPWNYPFLLTIEPLIDAIAAGNTAVVKPSAYSPATSALIKEMIEECFEPKYVAVVTGGRAENAALLSQKFDLIFFTGSTAVGKEVLRHAAENLTPAILELGGKSPCIIGKSADIPLSARRIVFGKFLNCGQTCVAPDYILCPEDKEEELTEQIKKEIIRQFGAQPLLNPDYGKIINKKHFDRLLSLIDENKLAFGGKSDAESLRIEPTVLTDITLSDAVMGEEIFGPILPILTYKSKEDIYKTVKDHKTPLALYLFSKDKGQIREITERIPFGGGCINDTVIHLATSEMGFGGVGNSGMGSYHGEAGFNAFSHKKSIVQKHLFIDLPMRYQPYKKEKYEKLIKALMK